MAKTSIPHEHTYVTTIQASPYIVEQIGVVVPDLERAMQSYWQSCGIGPWMVYTNSAPPLTCIYRGRPANYKVRVALAVSGQVQMELIEFIEGDTIHRDFLRSGQQGIEHFGVFVPDLDEALKPFIKKGISILQQVNGLGLSKDGRYAYLDTQATLGTVLELIQKSTQPMPPEQIYPVLY